MAEFIRLENSFVKRIEETKENIELLCPIENQGIVIFYRKVGNVVLIIFGEGQRFVLVGFFHVDMGFKRGVHPS